MLEEALNFLEERENAMKQRRREARASAATQPAEDGPLIRELPTLFFTCVQHVKAFIGVCVLYGGCRACRLTLALARTGDMFRGCAQPRLVAKDFVVNTLGNFGKCMGLL